MDKTIFRMDEDAEEIEASVSIWEYVFGFTKIAAVKCAIDLGIADKLEKNGGLPMSLSNLSSSLHCSPCSLARIMRFLTSQKIFTQTIDTELGLSYSQTPLSRRLLMSNDGKNTNSMASYILLTNNPIMLSPLLNLGNRVQEQGESTFKSANGEDIWKFSSDHSAFNKLFNDAMASDASQVVSNIVKARIPGLFEGVSSLVDVGGGNGTTLSLLVDAFPWLHGTNLDLPQVVADALPMSSDRVKHVGGDMFDSIPRADVAFLKWVLHDWGDDECIEILKKCKDAIPKDKGKVIIVEAIIADIEDMVTSQDKLEDARLMFDIEMMAITAHGKERTLREWDHVLKQAGFSHFKVYSIQAIQSVIEVYP